MKNFILSAFMVLTALSCEKKITETVDVQTANPDSITVPESNEPIESSTLQTCYMEATGKDTLFITLDDNLGTITGKMRYKNFEKDSSFGDVMGTQNGDTLKLNYTFESEGTTSDREIYFLKKDGNLIEGIGEHKTEGNRDFYANTNQLKYEGHTLKSTDCTDFEKNFKIK
ncbi:MAG: hypothetical protein ACXWVZ_06850 [Kaistella sp.]